MFNNNDIFQGKKWTEKLMLKIIYLFDPAFRKEALQHRKGLVRLNRMKLLRDVHLSLYNEYSAKCVEQRFLIDMLDKTTKSMHTSKYPIREMNKFWDIRSEIEKNYTYMDLLHTHMKRTSTKFNVEE